ncbi:MAG: tetratricopeptide repeat protein [Marinoscillum sp.]
MEFEEAHHMLTQALDQSRKGGWIRYEILANINLGGLYFRFSASEDALKYFLKALELAEANKVDDLLNSIYNNIGIIYSNGNSYAEAIRFYTKALEISREQNIPKRIAMNLMNLGTTLQSKGETNTPLKYYQQALQLFIESGDSLNSSAALGGMGSIYLQEQAFNKALDSYKKALTICKMSNVQVYASDYNFGIGRSFYHLHNYDSARLYLQQSLDGNIRTNNTAEIINCYLWLFKVADASAQNSLALEMLRLSNSWKDTLIDEKTSKWISELQLKYEFGKKEKELELLQAETERQNLILVFTIAIGAIITFLILYIFESKNVNLKQRNLILKKQSELDFLSIEKNTLEKKNLEQELTYRNRELATISLNLINKNDLLSSLYDLINNVQKDRSINEESVNTLHKAKKIIKDNENADKEWEVFKIHFEKVHPGFFTHLLATCPNLSPNELRLSAYLLIDLNSKEISQIFNISPESLRKKKQRLKKKLGLVQDEEMRSILDQIKIKSLVNHSG